MNWIGGRKFDHRGQANGLHSRSHDHCMRRDAIISKTSNPWIPGRSKLSGIRKRLKSTPMQFIEKSRTSTDLRALQLLDSTSRYFHICAIIANGMVFIACLSKMRCQRVVLECELKLRYHSVSNFCAPRFDKVHPCVYRTDSRLRDLPESNGGQLFSNRMPVQPASIICAE